MRQRAAAFFEGRSEVLWINDSVRQLRGRGREAGIFYYAHAGSGKQVGKRPVDCAKNKLETAVKQPFGQDMLALQQH